MLDPTPDPNEDFCRKLCEEFGLTTTYKYHEGEPPVVDEDAMSAISKAIHIVMEEAAKAVCAPCEEDEPMSTTHPKMHDLGNGLRVPCYALAIRSLQLSAEDVRTEGK